MLRSEPGLKRGAVYLSIYLLPLEWCGSLFPGSVRQPQSPLTSVWQLNQPDSLSGSETACCPFAPAHRPFSVRFSWLRFSRSPRHHAEAALPLQSRSDPSVCAHRTPTWFCSMGWVYRGLEPSHLAAAAASWPCAPGWALLRVLVQPQARGSCAERQLCSTFF